MKTNLSTFPWRTSVQAACDWKEAFEQELRAKLQEPYTGSTKDQFIQIGYRDAIREVLGLMGYVERDDKQ